jgi:large conductance mechanosensitive channel
MTDRISTGLRGASHTVKGSAKVLQGFKDFISRGNAIELAVGVVLGAAFGAVVSSIVEGLVTPLIAAIFGQRDLSSTFDFTINGAYFSFGRVLNALILFLCTAAAIYFFVVLPLNALANRRKRGLEEEPAAPSEDILLLQEIRDLLAARPSVAHNPRHASDGPVPPSGPPSIPPGT